MRKLITILLLAFSQLLFGQLKTELLSDSIKVGEWFEYSVKYSYPIEDRIILPDSSSDFYPLECFGVKNTGTSASDSTITDSATYIFSTFFLNKLQFYNFSLKHCTPSDTTLVKGPTDTLRIYLITEGLPLDSLKFKTHSQWIPIKYGANYRLRTLQGILLIVLITGLVAILWKPLTKNMRAQRLKKRVTERLFLMEALANKNEDLGEYLDILKQALSRTEGTELRSKTNMELAQHYRDDTLKKHLARLDQIIYNPRTDLSVGETHQFFKDFVEAKLESRIHQIKQGNG